MPMVFWKVKQVQPVVGAWVTKCACKQSSVYRNFFFLKGGFPATLKSGHRDIPYFHEWNKPPQLQSLSAPSESQFRGIGSSMAHKFFTVLTTHATNNPVAMSTTCTEIPNA